MKFSILPIILVFLIPLNSFTQKEDFVWKSGLTETFPGTTFYHFTENSFEMRWITQGTTMIRDNGSKSTIADEEGNLLFYTDGFDIFNVEHQIMNNGDTLFNLNLPGEDRYLYEFPGGFHVFGRTLIIPLPNADETYLVLSQDLEWIFLDFLDLKVININYSIVDMGKNNGLGEVIDKRNIFLEGSFDLTALTAIRHANGRDWWLPVKAFEQNKWYVFLIDPGGIELSHVQEINEIPDFGAEIKLYNYSRDQFILKEKPVFHPGGQDYYENNFFVFDFDRCTGYLDYSRSFTFKTPNHRIALGGAITIDQSGQYMYGNSHRGDLFFKYDIDSGADEPDFLFAWDDLGHSRFGLWGGRLTPQGEIWVTNYADSFITVIRNPELPGTEVNVDPEPVTTAWLNQGFFPNNANYRIGPIDHSPCDTLGINNEPIAWFRYNGMNLDHLERRFTDISYFRPEEWHWDFDDGTTYDGQHPGVHEFPGPGEYYVCLTVSNEFAEHTWCDWVVIDSLPTSVREFTTERDFRLYPNPGTGEFTIELDDPLSTSSNLTVIDMLGREVHREVVSSGKDEIQLSLPGLPSGRYAVVLRNGEVVLRGSLILLE